MNVPEILKERARLAAEIDRVEQLHKRTEQEVERLRNETHFDDSETLAILTALQTKMDVIPAQLEKLYQQGDLLKDAARKELGVEVRRLKKTAEAIRATGRKELEAFSKSWVHPAHSQEVFRASDDWQQRYGHLGNAEKTARVMDGTLEGILSHAGKDPFYACEKLSSYLGTIEKFPTK